MTIQEKSTELANQHFNYISKLIDISVPKDALFDKSYIMDMCRFHYLTAWEHGAKHYAELMDGIGSQETTKVKKAYDVRDWLSPAHVNELLAGEID